MNLRKVAFFESLELILIISEVKPSIQKMHTGQQLTPRVNNQSSTQVPLSHPVRISTGSLEGKFVYALGPNKRPSPFKQLVKTGC